MSEPSADTVQAFWAYMSEAYGSTIVPKATASEMKLVAAFLDALKIQDEETFMKRFTTTIGKRVYTPFEIGVPNEFYSLWGQVRVCVHEHQHVEQGEREGWAEFDIKYVTSASFRAGFEAEAFGCDMEMEYWHQGSALNLEQFAQDRPLVLKSYGCSDEDIEQARQMLSIRAGVIGQGVIETASARRAIAWLETFAPQLKAA